MAAMQAIVPYNQTRYGSADIARAANKYVTSFENKVKRTDESFAQS